MARILILSLREVDRTAVWTINPEFEDVIAEIDDVDIELLRRGDRSSSTFRIRERAAVHSPLWRRLNPGLRPLRVSDRHELAVVVVGELDDLVALNAVRGMRQGARRAVCVLREAWREDFPRKRGVIALLNQFDHVFLEYRQSVDELQGLIDVPCTYLATGIDAVRFCPMPRHPARSIDVYNMGRRVPEVHQALLSERQRTGLFYYFSSVDPARVWDPVDHRLLLADVLQRSRFALVKRAKFDSGHQHEIGFRYFEGAAAGAVLIGERVANEVFDTLFDWPDAVIETGDADVLDRVRELSAQPDRVAAISRANVVNTLRRHDCAYRWEEILRTVDMAPLPQLEARRRHLEELARSAESASTHLS